VPSFQIHHHGGVDRITCSCHQFNLDKDNAILIDYGLLQSAETSPGGCSDNEVANDFDWPKSRP